MFCATVMFFFHRSKKLAELDVLQKSNSQNGYANGDEQPAEYFDGNVSKKMHKGDAGNDKCQRCSDVCQKGILVCQNGAIDR